MVQVVVLGSGTPNPDRGRAGASVAIVGDENMWILIDAGRAATQRAIDAGLDLDRLLAVFITHHHSDHLSDLATLATTKWVGGAADPLTVVAPAGPACRFARACLDAYDDQCFHGQGGTGAARPSVIAHEFDPSANVAVVWQHHGWTVSSALVDHHPVAPAVGFRIEIEGSVIAVSGDTAVCEGMRALGRDADVLVHEAVLSKTASPALLAWNAAAGAVGQMAASIGVRTLILTHLLPAPRHEDDERAYVAEARAAGWAGELHVARDLLRLEVHR